MKKAVLYILLFAYCVSVVKPLLPFVADAVAHAFFYQKHIATVHWKNGKSHVHHEFINEAKKDSAANRDVSSKKLIPSDDHIYNSLNYCCTNFTFKLHLFSPDIIKPAANFPHLHFPPPKHPVA